MELVRPVTREHCVCVGIDESRNDGAPFDIDDSHIVTGSDIVAMTHVRDTSIRDGDCCVFDQPEHTTTVGIVRHEFTDAGDDDRADARLRWVDVFDG